MLSEPGTPTLDQLRVFLTVVEVGSFAAAARKLHRATSVISYTIANLETQLGVLLFDRHTTRKPQLTEAGRTVLAEARTITNGINGLRAKVKGLLQGLEAEVHLVVDVMLPAERVVDALKSFREAFPTVALHLHMEALGAVTELLVNREAILGEVNAPGAGRELTQLVLSDRSHLTKDKDFAVLSNRTWRLADLGAKHMLLREGIGWGNMPTPMVQEDLDSGRLVKLKIPEYERGDYTFDVIYRTDAPPGPAAKWLIERFVQQSA
jgi:DNA-binding transcriptional LysR family regulator